MAWTILTIRELDDEADGVMYPVPTESVNGIEMDEHDGECAPIISATTVDLVRVEADGSRKTIFRASDVNASIYITSSRVAIACTKYDKGGGWTGTGMGAVVAVAANAVSKGRAAARRHGKSLVGHVRYPWLSQVGYVPKTGWLSNEQVRIVSAEKAGGEKRTLILTLTLPKSMSAEKVATEIVRRAAWFRLHRTRFDSPDEQAKVSALVYPPTLAAEKGQFPLWRFPTYFFANATTAYGNLVDRT